MSFRGFGLVVGIVAMGWQVLPLGAQLPPSLSIEYTGGLFGYYRMEHEEKNRLLPVEQFLKKREKDHRLLLGMGDNFGPEFGASLQLESSGECWQPMKNFKGGDAEERRRSPIALYKDSDRIARQARCDNVTAFLMEARYRAVVPGREDFLYSATWLQGIAQLLRDASDGKEKKDEEKLHLLAANLRMAKSGSVKPDTTKSDKSKSMAAAEKTAAEKAAEEAAAKADKKEREQKKETECPLLFADMKVPGSAKAPGDTKVGDTTAGDTKGGDAKTAKTKAAVTVCVSSDGENVPVAQDWVERLDLTLDPDNGVAQTIFKRGQNNIYVRRQTLVNQVDIVQAVMRVEADDTASAASILSKDDAFVRALTTLSNPESYELNGEMLTLKRDAHTGMTPEKVMEVERASACGKISVEEAQQGDFCLMVKRVAEVFSHVNAQESLKNMNFLIADDGAEAARRSLLLSVGREQENRGFTFSDRDGERTLVIGVVGPETMKAVSPVNFASVSVLDPKRTLEVVLRGAKLLSEKRDSVRVKWVIVMAQMPRTETEELGARVREYMEWLGRVKQVRAMMPGGREPLEGTEPDRIDLMLSEAQSEHATAKLTMEYDQESMTPVLTPYPVFDGRAESLRWPVSRATVGGGRVANRAEPKLITQGGESTLQLLGRALTELGREDKTGDSPVEKYPTSQTIEYLMEVLQKHSGADVVMLERRDVYAGGLPDGYHGYEVCDEIGRRVNPWSEKDKARCHVHVALDRILWKGDYSERVMVTGKDLKGMIAEAQSQVSAEMSLAARDTSQQWLVTFGITTNDERNLTRLERNGDNFSIPWNVACKGDPNEAKQAVRYCVTGSTITDDGGYWVATSDHIANDKAVYSEMKNEPNHYHNPVEAKAVPVPGPGEKPQKQGKEENPRFLTEELANILAGKIREVAPTVAEGVDRATKEEHDQQQRTLLHVDYAKIVAGFNIRHPQGGNPASADFQGVTDTRASQPTQQEIDLEGVNRLSIDIGHGTPLAAGMQTDLEYDRAAIGNLTQRPINATYPSNSFTVGGFVQVRVPFWGTAKTTHDNWANRELPRMLLVLSPMQYRQQLSGTSLFLPFTSTAGLPPGHGLASSYEFTVHTPRVTALVNKLGARAEFAGEKYWPDRGSYAEAGWQLAEQQNVLASVTLTSDGLPPRVCPANGESPFSTCFNGYPIDGTTTTKDPSGKSLLLFRSLQASGAYWDVHLQKGLMKDKKTQAVGVNVSLDTKGDFFLERSLGNSLSTQTRYDVPVSFAVNFPVLRNLSFSPTYSAFFYENQIGRQSIVVHTFMISAKWFYDRDAGVPLRRMLMFIGPGSLDQTKTAKMK
jgi:hypothetical protein